MYKQDPPDGCLRRQAGKLRNCTGGRTDTHFLSSSHPQRSMYSTFCIDFGVIFYFLHRFWKLCLSCRTVVSYSTQNSFRSCVCSFVCLFVRVFVRSCVSSFVFVCLFVCLFTLCSRLYQDEEEVLCLSFTMYSSVIHYIFTRSCFDEEPAPPWSVCEAAMLSYMPFEARGPRW